MSILDIQNMTKHFGGLVAVDNLSLAVAEGELRCIIGPNGAGKSTLFNLICGTLEADGGHILFRGEPLNGLSVEERSRLGIGRKYQSPIIFESLTVLENLQVATWGYSPVWNLTRASQSQVAAHVDQILETVELADKRYAVAQTLAHGEKQWLEIGMVLASRPALLLLDEPTAGMTPAETHRTSELIKAISKQITTVVIEHDLKFIREIGNIVTVLHRGAVLAEGPIDDIARNETVRLAYLGTKEL